MASGDSSGLRMRDYVELLNKAKKSGAKADLLAALKHMRRSKIVDPANCIELSSKVIKSLKSSISTEDRDTDGAMLGFDVCNSALVGHLLPWLALQARAPLLQIISAQFPPKTSQRSKRLLGMILEANGELDDAEKLYQGMLELNKANALAYKRLICVALARGDTDGAVKQLNEYVKNFTADYSAWLQLAELHEQEQRWAFAAYCYEEVVLLKPAEPFPHCKVAECILRQVIDTSSEVHSSTDELNGAALQARKHAAHAVQQSSSAYPRALWCLAAACRAVAFVKAGRASECLDVRVLEALDFGAPVGSDASLASSWGGYVGAGSGAAGTLTLDDKLAASDDNYALFVAAAKGLQEAYKESSAAAATFTQLEALRVAYSPANWDGEISGSWSDAVAALHVMSGDIVSVTK